jgi:hypothetical protein
MERWVVVTLSVGLALMLIGGPLVPAAAQGSRVGVPAPEISPGPWINSPPLTIGGLRGRVVLVEFWTYG